MLAEAIVARMGHDFNTYFEPFLGGAALLLHLEPEHAVCSDINPELVNFYHVVQNEVEGLLNEIHDNYLPFHGQDFYYHVRSLDRDAEQFGRMTPVERAARFIYLNKTCFNGLWRVNRQGFNNVPWGRHDNLNLWNENNLMNVHNYLMNNDIDILHADYTVTAHMAEEGDLVYFDPPYDDDRQEGFTDYAADGFTRQNQTELRDLCNELVDNGVQVAVSNADTTFIRELFDDARYHIYDDIVARRSIGARAENRGKVNELLIIGG